MNNGFDLRVMGLLLRQGRRIHALSWLLLGVASLWLLLGTFPQLGSPDMLALTGLWLSLAAGALQAYCAIRVDFDAGLLIALAENYDPARAAAQLDSSLQALGLTTPAGLDRSRMATSLVND
jgi:hypothetical protein